MEIKNEEHATAMILEWQKLSAQVQKREVRLAIQQLELNSMYYEQKGNDQGVTRSENCILILKDHLETLED